MAGSRVGGLLKRIIYYPLCGIIAAALAVTLVFVLSRQQLGEQLYRRGLEQYHDGDYDEALTSFSLALKCDPDHKQAKRYRALCHIRLAPVYDVVAVRDLLENPHEDMQQLGIELAIRRNLRGMVEHIAPLARSDNAETRQAAHVALRVLRSVRVRVRCQICQRDATVTVEAGQGYPVVCPFCNQVAARPLWQCGECGHEWVPPHGAAWSCPKCGSPRVGGGN
jgi:hypothetical protein